LEFLIEIKRCNLCKLGKTQHESNEVLTFGPEWVCFQLMRTCHFFLPRLLSPSTICTHRKTKWTIGD
jgi:hypothetical protein